MLGQPTQEATQESQPYGNWAPGGAQPSVAEPTAPRRTLLEQRNSTTQPTCKKQLEIPQAMLDDALTQMFLQTGTPAEYQQGRQELGSPMMPGGHR